MQNQCMTLKLKVQEEKLEGAYMHGHCICQHAMFFFILEFKSPLKFQNFNQNFHKQIHSQVTLFNIIKPSDFYQSSTTHIQMSNCRIFELK